MSGDRTNRGFGLGPLCAQRARVPVRLVLPPLIAIGSTETAPMSQRATFTSTAIPRQGAPAVARRVAVVDRNAEMSRFAPNRGGRAPEACGQLFQRHRRGEPYFYDCPGCAQVLRPLPGHCCVFCSYGSVPCPPIQESRACCSRN